MWFFSIRQQRRQRTRRLRPTRPQVEALEDRCLLSTAGYLDTTFNSPNGYVSNLPGSGSGYGNVAVYPPTDPNGNAGKIVAAGVTDGTQTQRCVALTRYNANGTLDTSFGTNGLVTTTVSAKAGWGGGANGVVIDSQGRILVCGTWTMSQRPVAPYGEFDNEWVVARYTANGNLDKTFGKSGIVQTNIGPGADGAGALGIEPWDGKIVVVGKSQQPGTDGRIVDNTGTVTRYNTNGTLDSTFGSNGIFLLNNLNGPTGASGTGASGLAFNQTTDASGQAVNQIVLAGSDNGAILLARLNGSNGTLDTSFNGQGYVISIPPTSSRGWANSVVIQANGSIVAAGGSDTGLAVAQFTPGGAPDTTFGNTPGSNYALIPQLGAGYGMAVAPNTNGELNIAGYVSVTIVNPDGSTTTTTEAAVARLLADGSGLDATFGTSGGYSPLAITGTNYTGIALDANANLDVVGGTLLARYCGTTSTTTAAAAAATAGGSSPHSGLSQPTSPALSSSSPAGGVSLGVTDSALASLAPATAGPTALDSPAGSASPSASGWSAFHATVLGFLQPRGRQWGARMSEE
jgi:uncharacterized delta-60 repeat protein